MTLTKQINEKICIHTIYISGMYVYNYTFRVFSCGKVTAGQSLDLYMPYYLHTCCGFGYIYKVPFIFILYFHISSFRTCFACSLPCFTIDSAWPKSTFLFAVILWICRSPNWCIVYYIKIHVIFSYFSWFGPHFQQHFWTLNCYWIKVNIAMACIYSSIYIQMFKFCNEPNWKSFTSSLLLYIDLASTPWFVGQIWYSVINIYEPNENYRNSRWISH